MNSEKLSLRLERVASYIPKGSVLADIGSDHAYLPCYCILNGIASSAIAGEVVEGPFQSAKKQVKQNGLEERISVRKGNGLEVIEPGEVDCITIAGMGGPLIASILEEGKEKLADVKKLILQPNIGAISIREWLIENGWELKEEEILEEDGKVYEILAAEQGNPNKPYLNLDRDLLMGPFLIKDQNAPFRKKWQAEVTQWKNILNQLQGAGDNEKTSERKQEITKKIQLVEEVLD
ncbi:tRNA (adenine(22)-N(1))-methyltransferase [Falsibacillus pallidus]|uniref:tRNA (Adenine22-N1)-methyltransferase n=1 Tax=Falsibacillus pallidus TaxID=493781 RepID=A0A370GJM2_9BACI|nr:tRNA (adenine(22)-N(1))-methyltransferase TrmK [Falsibacillus pallidus]RDI43988.1 tRNA (adenine22-N1)-methyltransferase [Falsibacillus pallidus]